ncbi:hypothetical protein CLOP_g20385 [Closterium sp. NIES-67]|nr:hypothetical protein CLOP_g20385 [Closterium sp. NIES-67]
MASLTSRLPPTPAPALLRRSPPSPHSVALLSLPPSATHPCRTCCPTPRSAATRTPLARPAALRLPAGFRGGKPLPCRAADAQAAGEGAGEREVVSLGTAVLPGDCDLESLEAMMAQWATSLTQNANLPLQSPLKVDRVPGGVRLGVEVSEDDTTRPVDIIVTVEPASAESPAMFRAVRAGPHCQLTPPGEPALMASMLSALRKSVALSRPPPPPQ